MSQENKIDFTKSPGDNFYRVEQADGVSDDDYNRRPDEMFCMLHMGEGRIDFDRLTLFMIIATYMRINATKWDNKFRIISNAALDTLTYKENFFIELFNRYKIICECNELIGKTATILEYPFSAGAYQMDREFEGGYHGNLLECDWSKNGFSKRDCSLFFKDYVIWQSFVEKSANDCSTYYIETHHLAPLLNILPKEKQLCTPILYITYLTNLFEKLGWDTNNCEELVDTYLENVMAVQADSRLWAIQTLQVVLFGCDKKLISEANDLTTINNRIQNKEEDRFDVIFLPEVNYISDVGPIIISNIIIEKTSNVYYVAFLYNMLSDNGRMLVRLHGGSTRYDKNSELLIDSEDKLITFFVDNNLIEAMIQTEDCVYMLIDKNRPETKYEKVLFYYTQHLEYNFNCYPQKNENLASSIEEYSCEYIKLRHDEGVVIVSNQVIRLNDYCLLPKKYIYNFDRITANAEFQVVRHIAHDLSPKLATVDSVLKHLTRFIASHELLQKPLQEQFYEGQTLEPVGEAIDKARSDISHMHKLIKDTRKVITEEIPLEDFSSVNLRDLLEATKKKYANGTITLDIVCDQDIQYEMHKTSFAEMIDNFVRNAEVHGFVNGGTGNHLSGYQQGQLRRSSK
jgi:hypothetical protein